MHIICTFKLHNRVMFTKSGCRGCLFCSLLKLVSAWISANQELNSVIDSKYMLWFYNTFQSLGGVQVYKRRTENLPGIGQEPTTE